MRMYYDAATPLLISNHLNIMCEIVLQCIGNCQYYDTLKIRVAYNRVCDYAFHQSHSLYMGEMETPDRVLWKIGHIIHLTIG